MVGYLWKHSQHRVMELDCIGSWETGCIGVHAVEDGVGTPFWFLPHLAQPPSQITQGIAFPAHSTSRKLLSPPASLPAWGLQRDSISP